MHLTRPSRIAVGLAAVLLLASACAAQPGGAPAPPPLPGMTPVAVAGLADAPAAGLSLTAAQVSAAILAATDVPAGWTRAAQPSSAVTEASKAGAAGHVGSPPRAGTSPWPAARLPRT